MYKVAIFPVLCSLLMAVSCRAKNPVLTIEGGQVQGVESNTPDVLVFRGIPFAAPTSGENRWREPQSVIPWEGVKIADKWAPAAPQAPDIPGSFYQKEFRWNSGPEGISEDCLYLNIWTNAAGKTRANLPVAMWIHGGGYTRGYTYETQMDGESWASRGVILVTVAYRLGIFGFMAHPALSAESAHEVSGNYGILDQIAALKWIKNNIRQFGGDPNNITIVGQSAGAGSVQTLCASPLSRDLIQKAMSQSGGGLRSLMSANTLATAEQAGKSLMDFYGKTTLEEMRAIPVDTLLNYAARSRRETGQRISFSPVIDGYVLEQSFSDAARSDNIADIPYLIGYTLNDLGDMRESIADFCKLREQQGGKAYAYLFSRQLPGDDSGAFHSSELWYMFHTLGRSWRPFTEADFALSNQMVDFWTNFARSGNPNGKDLPEWIPYTNASPDFMIFNIGQ